jgi:hypothetical protein
MLMDLMNGMNVKLAAALTSNHAGLPDSIFQTNNYPFGQILEGLAMKMITPIWYILWPFGIFVGHFGIFVGHFVIFVSHFVIFVGHFGIFVGHFGIFVGHFGTFVGHFGIFSPFWYIEPRREKSGNPSIISAKGGRRPML